uniref:Transmembrane BAX inhibitor motif containing 6 n=1 Tax=Gallus gallus TaxID=9031 RepID=A0A8V0ZUC5_CHICK
MRRSGGRDFAPRPPISGGGRSRVGSVRGPDGRRSAAQHQLGCPLQVLPYLSLHPGAPEEGLWQLCSLYAAGGRGGVRQCGHPSVPVQPAEWFGLPGADGVADSDAPQQRDGAAAAGDAGRLCLPHRHQPGAPPADVHRHQPSIIPTAFLGTAAIFGCFSLSALYARRRSFLYLGGFLLSGLTLLLLSSLLNALLGSVWLFTANLYVGLMLMCGFVLFDTQLIIEKAESGDKDYIWHCVDLFLDFVNIFRELLMILGVNENKKKEKK